MESSTAATQPAMVAYIILFFVACCWSSPCSCESPSLQPGAPPLARAGTMAPFATCHAMADLHGPGAPNHLWQMINEGRRAVLSSGLKNSCGICNNGSSIAASSERSRTKGTSVYFKGLCINTERALLEGVSNLSAINHLDSRPATVNLWTAIPDSRVQIGNVSRTAQATNKVTELNIYLDFTDPVRNTSSEILSVLNTSDGILTVMHRKSHGNRRFAFHLTNVKSVAAVTVSFDTSHIVSRDGSIVVQPSAVTFLYDSVRPQVKLSTTSRAKSRDRDVAVLIEFSKPVLSFASDDLMIMGGEIVRFEEVSKSIYALRALAGENMLLTILVVENKTMDIAGNFNLPSNVIRVRHYIIPAVSIALYSFTTASLLATSFVAGVLSISSTTLAAAGALSIGTMGSIVSDPSRNLLGMAGHLQMFALSEGLAVSLPIDYRETVKGLQWLIPHVRLPWERPPSEDTVSLKRKLLMWQFATQTDYVHNTAALLKGCNLPVCHYKYSNLQAVRRWRVGVEFDNKMDLSVMNSVSGLSKEHTQRGRKLAANATLYGQPLTPTDYQLFFEAHVPDLSAAENFLGVSPYTGWQDFKMNIFWLGAVGGALIFLHLCILGFLRWRTGMTPRSALLVPRFELFLLIFALPGICQALASIIRGGTTAGIILGVILLAIPAAFLLSVVLFLFFALLVGTLVQYYEVRWQSDKSSSCKRLFAAIFGANSVGTWTCKEGLSSAFLPRFGLLFEDRKGPPKLVVLDGSDNQSVPKWIHSGANGIGRMRAVNSDEESEEAVVSSTETVIGALRAGYIVIDLARRVVVGLLFGAYPRSDCSWSQVSIVFGCTVGQLIYLLILRPYIRRGVQIVETVSLLCEAALFALGLTLLASGNPLDSQVYIGTAMLALLLATLVVQLVNEWYALMNQLLRLSTSQQPSLKRGVEVLLKGLILPLMPQDKWAGFISREPKTGLVTVVQSSPEEDLKRQSESAIASEPDLASTSEIVIPAYGPGSPCFIDPRTISSTVAQKESTVYGEISAEPTQPGQGQPWNQWNFPRAMEGKRSRGVKTDARSTELKALRELAKASFPRGRKDEKVPADMAEVGGSVGISSRASPSSLVVEQQTPSRRGGIPFISHSSSGGSSSDESDDMVSQKESAVVATAAVTHSSS